MANPGYQSERAAKKKSDILAAAAELFLESGYERASLAAVAKRAGVSSATVFSHFKTKAGLFGAVAASLWVGPLAPVSQQGLGRPAAEGLAEIARGYADLLLQPQTVALFRVIIAEAERFPELGRSLYEHGKKPYLDRLEMFLRESEALDIAPNQVSIAARELLGMINDQLFWPALLLADFTVEAAAVDAVLSSAVATFLARYQRS